MAIGREESFAHEGAGIFTVRGLGRDQVEGLASHFSAALESRSAKAS